MYDHRPQPASSRPVFTTQWTINPSAAHAVPPGFNGDISNLSFVVLYSTLAAPKALTKSF
jgi:hypothetical protein